MLRQRLPKSLLASIVVSSLALISIQSTIARPNSYPSKTHPTAIIFLRRTNLKIFIGWDSKGPIWGLSRRD